MSGVIGATEKTLFAMLAQSHLMYGGTIGFRGLKWFRDGNDEGSYLGLDEKGKVIGNWGEAVNVIQSIILTINRERKTYDDVYFFFMNEGGSYVGVTWRMLKIDMNYLRVVLSRDGTAMKEIITRIVRISEKALNEPDEPFENLN
jgi:hypothetical protein